MARGLFGSSPQVAESPRSLRGVLVVVRFGIDTTTGWKVDLIIRKDRPFSAAEFARHEPVTIAGVATAVATAEDTILAKLE